MPNSVIVTTASNVDNFGMYEGTIFNIFNCHVTIKIKYISVNEAPFMTEELHKAIMNSNNSWNIEPILTKKNKNYNIQRNLCKKSWKR